MEMNDWQVALETDDPTMTSARLAAIYAQAHGVNIEQARAAVGEEIAKLDSLERAELALADCAPAATLLALAAEIEGEIAGAPCANCYSESIAEHRAYARALRAAAASRVQ